MTSTIPNHLKYTKDHEWILIEGDTATIGITDFAQSQLGDIVFVELPDSGTTLEQGDSFGVVESIKSVSDLYAPLGGEVLEKNEELETSPESCNNAPYKSWMIKIKINNDAQSDELLTHETYALHCRE